MNDYTGTEPWLQAVPLQHYRRKDITTDTHKVHLTPLPYDSLVKKKKKKSEDVTYMLMNRKTSLGRNYFVDLKLDVPIQKKNDKPPFPFTQDFGSIV